MKTLLLWILGTCALASIGNYHSRAVVELDRKAATLEIRTTQLEADAKNLPSAPGNLQNARYLLETLQTQTASLRLQMQENALNKEESIRAAQTQEASAKKREKAISPSLRPLLLPPAPDLAPEALSKRCVEFSFLQTLLASGIDEIDYLSLTEAQRDANGSAPNSAPLEIRFRAKMGDLVRFLSRLQNGGSSLPLYRLDRVEMRPIAEENSSPRTVFLIDMRLMTLLPPASR